MSKAEERALEKYPANKNKVFSDVPIKVNEITSYRGKMFDGVTTVTSSSVGFTADPDWGGTNEYAF